MQLIVYTVMYMAIVKFIKSLDNGRVSVGVASDDNLTVYSIPLSAYDSMCFVVNGELSSEELSTIIELDSEYRAIKKALFLLSFSDKNKKTLYIRLLREGHSRENAKKAVEYCLSHGYINEEGQIERLVLREANHNLRGPRYIREKLMGKGYSRDDIDAVIDSLVELGEIDFVMNFRELCDKKGVTDSAEMSILAYKYGFRRE